MYPVLPFADADSLSRNMQGKPWTLKNVRGKVVLLNFWFTGWPPCVDDTTIAGYDDATALRRFLTPHSLSYPVVLDSGRQVTERFQVLGVREASFSTEAG